MQPQQNNTHETVVKELVSLLDKGNAHAPFSKAVKNVPFDVLGKRPNHLPYSIWQLTQHIRIAQWDILEFCKSENHKSPKWPEEYWPKETSPQNKEQWHETLDKIKRDQQEFIELLKDEKNDIYKPLPWGTGQSLLREALVLADHASYHTGEIILIRRLLGDWE